MLLRGLDIEHTNSSAELELDVEKPVHCLRRVNYEAFNFVCEIQVTVWWEIIIIQCRNTCKQHWLVVRAEKLRVGFKQVFPTWEPTFDNKLLLPCTLGVIQMHMCSF